ncbi:hypothetical protein K1I43_14420 [Anoxybacillus sp. ST70]|nr:hypothetical protein [Anoxybacillus sp. ST70]
MDNTLPASPIQAQREYFGAHTYERIAVAIIQIKGHHMNREVILKKRKATFS